MTRDEIIAARDALIAGAEGRELTTAECDSYEQLERDLADADRREAVMARQAAATAVSTPALVGRVSPRGDKDDTEARAFAEYLRTGQANADIMHLRARPDGTETRAQSESVATAGGFLVPDVFRNVLIKKLKAYGGIMNVAQEITTATGAPYVWPTMDDTGNVGEIVDEGGTFSSGADLVLGQAQLGAYKYVAGGASSAPIRISWELIQDAEIDIVDIVTDALSERIGRIMATHLVSGTGVGQPQGITTGRTGVQYADQSDGIKWADLVQWVDSLDWAYIQGGNCRWAFNQHSLAAIRKIVDENGRPMLQPANTGTLESSLGGYTLAGFPVTIDNSFPNISAASATVNWGVFGDLRRGYLVRHVKDVTMVVNPYSRASNFQTEYSAYARMDAVQQDTNAYIALTGGAVA
jgi:HK97 family phage major capsid protein